LRLRLREHGIGLLDAPSSVLPLRPLVGVSMPAVMIELGMLSNAEDERALNSADVSSRFITAILDTIAQVRQGIPAPQGAVQCRLVPPTTGAACRRRLSRRRRRPRLSPATGAGRRLASDWRRCCSASGW